MKTFSFLLRAKVVQFLLNKEGQKISYPADKFKASDPSYHRNRIAASTFAYRSDFFSLSEEYNEVHLSFLCHL